MSIARQDLKTVDPKGRLDVAAYRVAEHFTKRYESHIGVQGLWDNVEGYVQEIVSNGLRGIEIPGEIKILLGVLQANIKSNINPPQSTTNGNGNGNAT